MSKEMYEHFQYYEPVRISLGREVYVKRLTLRESVIFSNVWNAYILPDGAVIKKGYSKKDYERSERELLGLALDRVPAFLSKADKTAILTKAKKFNFPEPVKIDGNTKTDASNTDWVKTIYAFFMRYNQSKSDISEMFPAELGILMTEINRQEELKDINIASLFALGVNNPKALSDIIKSFNMKNKSELPLAQIDEKKIDALIAKQNRRAK